MSFDIELINKRIEQFLLDAGRALGLNDQNVVAGYICHQDDWEEVSNRIETIQSLNEQFNKKEWDFDAIKKVSSKSVLLTGAVSLSINVNTFFKHPEALECLKELLEPESPPTAELIDNWIIRITGMAFFTKDAKPSKSSAALFTSVMLAARYPDIFVDFRQNRWKSLVDFIGLDDFQGEYGEKLIYAGQITRAISQTNGYQQNFPAQYTNAVIGAMAYLIHNREDWFKEIRGTAQMSESDLPVKKQISSPLNQILYGPPGTGKTYKTAKLAVEICDRYADQDRDALMQRYTELTEKNRIGFVTFHQSYSYEDFVEGIRPVVGSTDESQNSLAYTIEDGIFKQMCAYANKVPSSTQQSELKLDTLDGRSFYKISVGGLYDPQVEDYCFEHGYISLGYGGDIDYSSIPKDKKYSVAWNAIKKLMDDNDYKRKNRFPIQVMSLFKAFIDIGDIVIVSKGMSKAQAIGVVTGNYEYKPDNISGYSHFRKVDWIIKDADIPVEKIQNRKFSQQTLYSLNEKALNKEFLESILCNKEIEGEAENHVLIIDEINRANISKVFGELITLLEMDKRAGAKNALSVKLPYSRDSFAIPDNLFVIGTMNTADRSIALLDTALRRRFEFKELMPDYDLPELDQEIDEIHLGKLLKTINDRIEYYFDREHTIGHAYLIGINDFSQLKSTLLNKIIPLLQEYFYEDWEKVSLVLGETNNSGIIQTEKLSSPDDNDEEKIRYKINQKMTVENIKSIYSSKGKNSETVESSDNL